MLQTTGCGVPNSLFLWTERTEQHQRMIAKRGNLLWIDVQMNAVLMVARLPLCANWDHPVNVERAFSAVNQPSLWRASLLLLIIIGR